MVVKGETNTAPGRGDRYSYGNARSACTRLIAPNVTHTATRAATNSKLRISSAPSSAYQLPTPVVGSGVAWKAAQGRLRGLGGELLRDGERRDVRCARGAWVLLTGILGGGGAIVKRTRVRKDWPGRARSVTGPPCGIIDGIRSHRSQGKINDRSLRAFPGCLAITHGRDPAGCAQPVQPAPSRGAGRAPPRHRLVFRVPLAVLHRLPACRRRARDKNGVGPLRGGLPVGRGDRDDLLRARVYAAGKMVDPA